MTARYPPEGIADTLLSHAAEESEQAQQAKSETRSENADPSGACVCGRNLPRTSNRIGVFRPGRHKRTATDSGALGSAGVVRRRAFRRKHDG